MPNEPEEQEQPCLWEAFTILTSIAPPSATQVIELLEQVEKQGYEPKFMQIVQQGCQIFGRKKDLPQLPESFSPESELPKEPSLIIQ